MQAKQAAEQAASSPQPPTEKFAAKPPTPSEPALDSEPPSTKVGVAPPAKPVEVLRLPGESAPSERLPGESVLSEQVPEAAPSAPTVPRWETEQSPTAEAPAATGAAGTDADASEPIHEVSFTDDELVEVSDDAPTPPPAPARQVEMNVPVTPQPAPVLVAESRVLRPLEVGPVRLATDAVGEFIGEVEHVEADASFGAVLDAALGLRFRAQR